MKTIKVKNHKELSEESFQVISNQIKKKPSSTLLIASGKTPKELYKKLTKSKLNFSKIKIFNLDEIYKTNTYKNYFHKNLLNKINIKKSNIHLINGKTKNPKQECNLYEKKLNKNKPDLTILGIGTNSHIAFNEPGSKKSSKTRLIFLQNKKKQQAITVGISTILKSKKILLLASGKKKKEAIKNLIKQTPSPKFPATLLKSHKDFTLIIDKTAGSLIK